MSPAGTRKGDNRRMGDSPEGQVQLSCCVASRSSPTSRRPSWSVFRAWPSPVPFPPPPRLSRGDHSDACYIVREGSFRVTREHSDGRAITLANLGPGRFRGARDARREVRSASVGGTPDGELLALPAGDVRALLGASSGDNGRSWLRPSCASPRRQRAHLQAVLPDRAQPGRGVLSQLVAEEAPREGEGGRSRSG